MKKEKYEMNKMKIVLILLLPIFFVFVSCKLEEPDIKKTESSTGSQDFSKYVAIGNSLTAGYQSGSIVVDHQRFSYPNLIAQQLDITDFEQPTVSWPGIPNIMTLESVTGDLGTASGNGAPTNLTLARPYDNMGIPGIVLADVDSALSTAQSYSQSAAIDLVLRGLGTQLQQALSLQPKFISCWIGNNDVLGFATSGGVSPSAPTNTQIFAFLYSELANSLAATGAEVIVANIPDVTAIPFFTTLPGIVLDPDRNPVLVNGNVVPLVGVNPVTDLVLLTAATAMGQGLGIPAELGGTGQPLPDQVFLDAGELAELATATAAFNATIEAVATQNGFALFDANGFFNQIVANGGFDPGNGMDILTTSYVSGGLFSLDGVHPTNLGYAIIANEFIKATNAKFGTQIQEVNLLDIAGEAPQSLAKFNNIKPGLMERTVEIFGGSIR